MSAELPDPHQPSAPRPQGEMPPNFDDGRGPSGFHETDDFDDLDKYFFGPGSLPDNPASSPSTYSYDPYDRHSDPYLPPGGNSHHVFSISESDPPVDPGAGRGRRRAPTPANMPSGRSSVSPVSPTPHRAQAPVRTPPISTYTAPPHGPNTGYTFGSNPNASPNPSPHNPNQAQKVGRGILGIEVLSSTELKETAQEIKVAFLIAAGGIHRAYRAGRARLYERSAAKHAERHENIATFLSNSGSLTSRYDIQGLGRREAAKVARLNFKQQDAAPVAQSRRYAAKAGTAGAPGIHKPGDIPRYAKSLASPTAQNHRWDGRKGSRRADRQHGSDLAMFSAQYGDNIGREMARIARLSRIEYARTKVLPEFVDPREPDANAKWDTSSISHWAVFGTDGIPTSGQMNNQHPRSIQKSFNNYERHRGQVPEFENGQPKRDAHNNLVMKQATDADLYLHQRYVNSYRKSQSANRNAGGHRRVIDTSRERSHRNMQQLAITRRPAARQPVTGGRGISGIISRSQETRHNNRYDKYNYYADPASMPKRGHFHGHTINPR